MRQPAIRYLYHLADQCNLASIERVGLLSASRLLERAGLNGTARARLERDQRRARTCLPGGAVIRDQSPMPRGALMRCLVDGTTPSDWYALLNSLVFFWLDPDRLRRQARACAPWPQVLLEIDAPRLLDRYAESAFVTPFNVGNAMRKAVPRGRASFVPLTEWRKSGWVYEATALGTARRPVSHRPVELVISDAIPEILDYVVQVRGLGRDGASI